MNEITVVNDELIVWKDAEYEPVTEENDRNDIYSLLDLIPESPENSDFLLVQRISYAGKVWKPRANREKCKHFIFIAYNKTRKCITYNLLLVWPAELNDYGELTDELKILIGKAYLIFASENHPNHWSRNDECEYVIDNIQDVFEGATWTTS